MNVSPWRRVRSQHHARRQSLCGKPQVGIFEQWASDPLILQRAGAFWTGEVQDLPNVFWLIRMDDCFSHDAGMPVKCPLLSSGC